MFLMMMSTDTLELGEKVNFLAIATENNPGVSSNNPGVSSSDL